MLSRMTQTALNQLRLMEQAFYVCRLDRYANAPDNRGWMNLFRNWGRSEQLNQIFMAYEHLFTREFVEFYLQYLAFYDDTIDERSVPHPWDPVPMRQRPRFPIALPWPGDLSNLIVRGIYLDPGLREADPFKLSTSHASAGEAGGHPSGPQPPTPAPDSSASTE